MSEKLLRIIMKYPIQSIITSIVLFLVFPLSIVVFKYNPIIELGITGIIFFGCSIGSLPLFLWWLISYGINKISFYEKNIPELNRKEYDIDAIGWEVNIKIGSIVGLLYCAASFLVTYFVGWHFKQFMIICISAPIIRFVIYFLFERNWFKKINDSI